MFSKISSFAIYSLLGGLFILCLLLASTISAGVVAGILLCLEVLIPSLLLFLILADLLQPFIRRHTVPRPLQWFCRVILHIDGRFFYIFLLGILGGYPIGAKLIADAVEQGHLEASQAKYLLRFCICCSPAFLISGVSVVLWDDFWIGAVLYSVQVLGGILIAFLGGIGHYVSYHQPKEAESVPAFSVLLVESVHKSVRQMAIICGFVLLFSGVFSLISLLPLPDGVALLIKGMLEVSVGCHETGSMSAYFQPLWIAIFTTFGGFCVHLQVLALCRNFKLDYCDFLLTRLILMVFCGGVVYGLLRYFPSVLSCFVSMSTVTVAPSERGILPSCLILLLCCFLLMLAERKIEVN